MKYRLLALAPLLAAAAIVVVGCSDAWPARDLVDAIHRAAPVAATLGCLLAALSYSRRDPLFRGWILQAVTHVLLVERDAVIQRGLLGAADGPLLAPIAGTLLVAANVAAVVGTWSLARAWQVMRLDLPGHAALRAMLRTAAVLLALFITAPSLSMRLRELATDTPGAVVGIAAVLADVLCLSMVAPVLLAAMSPRPAGVGWPWALFTASLFGWLCFDATSMLSAAVSSGGHVLWITGETFRVFACVATLAAGVAQHWVSRDRPGWAGP